MGTILVVQTPGPLRIPISMLRKRSIELDRDAEDPEGSTGPEMMVTHGVLDEYAIPFERFSLRSDPTLHSESLRSIRPLPDGVPRAVEPGVIVAMEGEEWVVVENAEGDWMALASTQYIDITQ